MRTRGSGTMSLELRQVDEDMHYRLLHRGREVETGIVVPGIDWFAPVAALYHRAPAGRRNLEPRGGLPEPASR